MGELRLTDEELRNNPGGRRAVADAATTQAIRWVTQWAKQYASEGQWEAGEQQLIKTMVKEMRVAARQEGVPLP